MNLVSLARMIKKLSLVAKKKFVMPAQAGIHLGVGCNSPETLDSGPGSSPGQALRRGDGPDMSKSILAIDRVVTNAVWALASALLALIACLGLYQVLVRFVFNQPSPWTEEVIGRLLIWTVALGIVAAFRQGALVSVDLMLRLSHGTWRRIVRLIIVTVTLVFLALLAWVGYDLAWRIRFQTFASLPISISWAYLAFPVGATFSALAVIANYFDPINRELETQQ